MSLEVATFISQLVATNPAASDKKNQGDDHFRLVKGVLQSTFPNASRAMRFGEVVTKTTTYNVVEADDNKTILLDASGGIFNVNLPAGLSFPGWTVRFMKIEGGANQIFVVPPSGTINGFAKIRVNVPTMLYEFLWTGGSFVRIDSTAMVKAGVLELYAGGASPPGYGLANGQSLLRTDMPELFNAWGTIYGAVDGTHFNAPNTLDRFIVSAGASYGLGSVGGVDSVVLQVSQMPGHGHVMDNPTHLHTAPVPVGKTGQATGFTTTTGQIWFGDAGVGNTSSAAANQTTQATGGDGSHENRPPYIALNYIFRLC